MCTVQVQYKLLAKYKFKKYWSSTTDNKSLIVFKILKFIKYYLLLYYKHELKLSQCEFFVIN